ncbi:hypothetical protein T12_3871, partial [Trichinella patagoniensis]
LMQKMIRNLARFSEKREKGNSESEKDFGTFDLGKNDPVKLYPDLNDLKTEFNELFSSNEEDCSDLTDDDNFRGKESILIHNSDRSYSHLSEILKSNEVSNSTVKKLWNQYIFRLLCFLIVIVCLCYIPYICNAPSKRTNFYKELKYLKSDFKLQNSMLWKVISTSIQSAMKDETSVLVISLLNDKNGKRTAQCLALRLANITSKLFSGNTLYSPSVTVFDSEDFNDSFGVTRLHERLQSFFSQYIYNVAIMKEFQNFSPVTYDILHAFFEPHFSHPDRVAFFLQITCDMDLSSVGYEKSYDKHIHLCLKNSAFAQTHSEDHFAALLSRIGGSVAIVTPEEANLDHACL